MINENNDYKIIIVGDSAVGKTCIIFRFVNNKFLDLSFNTIGADFFQKEVNINGDILKLKIWDTAGQEKFKSMTKSYFHGVDGVIFVFDITLKKTFEGIPGWIQLFNQESNDIAEFLLIGNKSDLADKRKVSIEEAQNFANSHKMEYFETSAKNNSNIEEAFTFLANKLLANLKKKQKSESNNVNIANKNTKKKCC